MADVQTQQSQKMGGFNNNMNVSSKPQGKQRTIPSNALPSQINNSNSNKVPDGSKEVPGMMAKKPSHWWLWLLIIVFVLGAAVAAYFFLLKGKVI
jgi:hypothetical protein